MTRFQSQRAQRLIMSQVVNEDTKSLRWPDFSHRSYSHEAVYLHFIAFPVVVNEPVNREVVFCHWFVVVTAVGNNPCSVCSVLFNNFMFKADFWLIMLRMWTYWLHFEILSVETTDYTLILRLFFMVSFYISHSEGWNELPLKHETASFFVTWKTPCIGSSLVEHPMLLYPPLSHLAFQPIASILPSFQPFFFPGTICAWNIGQFP